MRREGHTQRSLAELTDVPRATLGDYITGKTARPKLDHALAIEAATGGAVPVDSWLDARGRARIAELWGGALAATVFWVRSEDDATAVTHRLRQIEARQDRADSVEELGAFGPWEVRVDTVGERPFFWDARGGKPSRKGVEAPLRLRYAVPPEDAEEIEVRARRMPTSMGAHHRRLLAAMSLLVDRGVFPRGGSTDTIDIVSGLDLEPREDEIVGRSTGLRPLGTGELHRYDSSKGPLGPQVVD